jgi:hypothetical protein
VLTFREPIHDMIEAAGERPAQHSAILPVSGQTAPLAVSGAQSRRSGERRTDIRRIRVLLGRARVSLRER